MINNFMCERCDHYMVGAKVRSWWKFHETAKKDLMITLTMDECMDYAPDADAKGDEPTGDD